MLAPALAALVVQPSLGHKDCDSARETHPALAQQVAVCRYSCIPHVWLRRIIALHLLKVLPDIVAYLLLDTLWHAVVDVYARIIHDRRRVHPLSHIPRLAPRKHPTL